MKLDFKNPDVQVVLFAALFVIFIIIAFFYYVRLDEDLKNEKRIKEIQADFENDLKKIELPLKTAINKSENSGNRFNISKKRRYRTEMNSQEFFTYFRNQLEKLGWKYYASESEHPFERTDNFCKGKFDAKLSKEFSNIWSDGADYYELDFSFGHRYLKDKSLVPKECEQ